MKPYKNGQATRNAIREAFLRASHLGVTAEELRQQCDLSDTGLRHHLADMMQAGEIKRVRLGLYVMHGDSWPTSVSLNNYDHG